LWKIVTKNFSVERIIRLCSLLDLMANINFLIVENNSSFSY